MPYERDGDAELYRLIGARALERRYPATFAWLKANEEGLRARGGDWNDENWTGFSRRQNLERFDEPKVLVPYMSDHLCAYYSDDNHFFVNVATGGYGVGFSDTHPLNGAYLAALLNSHLLSWCMARYARAWRGGYAGARAGTLRRLPIALPDAGVQARVVELDAACRAALLQLDEAESDADTETLGRLCEATVRTFERTVGELYEVTPDELLLIA